MEHGVFDHAFITLADFTGTLSWKGGPLTLSPQMNERDVQAIFGELTGRIAAGARRCCSMNTSWAKWNSSLNFLMHRA